MPMQRYRCECFNVYTTLPPFKVEELTKTKEREHWLVFTAKDLKWPMYYFITGNF
jgi:hypothetical protein